MVITTSKTVYEIPNHTSKPNKPWMKFYQNHKEMIQDIIKCYEKDVDYNGIIRVKDYNPRISAETIGSYIVFKCVDNNPAYFWERNNNFKVPFTDSEIFLEKQITKMIKKKEKIEWSIKRVH
ncbi:hypothetical protein GF352_04735 [archaeon]|nr:hypothetical protein [archaeon]